MKTSALVLSLYLGTCSIAFAQASGGSSAGASAGAGGTVAGSTLSNGSTVSRTGGSPGPNTSNALGHGTTGNNLGAPQTGVAPGASASHGNAVDTPAANAATQSLGNTDAGVLKKYGCSEQGTDRASAAASHSPSQRAHSPAEVDPNPRPFAGSTLSGR
jgi:hypothetical protein